MNRRLYRCRQNRVLAGVAGGMAEFFGLDPSLVRVLWFLSIFFGGFSLLLYIAMAFFVPLEPLGEGVLTAQGPAMPAGHAHAAGSAGTGRLTTFVGIILVAFGGMALLGTVLPAPSWRYLWPVFIVGIGVLLIAYALRREPTKG